MYRQPVARVLAVVYGVYLVYYLIWRATSTLNVDALGFSLALLAIEASSLGSFALFAFMTWDVRRGHAPPAFSGAHVDVYVPTYNEDVSILEATLVGCNAITYPHTTYVLDDGRRAEVEALAARLGCEYLTRPDNSHAKAGNLNSAFRRTDGEFIVVLDADTVPQPDLLDKTLGYFSDPDVALVQLPQQFYNHDSVQHVRDTSVDSPWHEQELFYSVIQPGKGRWNASFWCGSPSVIRRTAIESVGGVATESITEDLHTTLRLHARGWKTVFHNENLAFGIAAQTLHAFGVQRLRWAQGTMQILRSRDNPLVLSGLSLAQRLCHFASMITYLEAYPKLAYLLAPPITLMTGVLPIRVDAVDFVLHWLPYFVLGVLANVGLGRGSFRYLATEQYNMLKMFTFIWASTILLWPRALRFRVTPKHVGASPYALERRQLVPHGVLLVFIGLGIVLGLANLVWGVTARFEDPPIIGATLVWALASGGLLTFTVQQILQRLHGRDQYRFATSVAGTLNTADGGRLGVSVDDLSVRGGSVVAPGRVSAGQNLKLSLHLPGGSISIAVEVVHARSLARDQSRLGLRFRAFSPTDRERLLEFLFVEVARRQGGAVPSLAKAPMDASFERAA